MNNYDIETEEYLAHGVNLFIKPMLGENEISHMVEYVKIFRPEGLVVDMGCGVGKTGEYIKSMVPNADVINVTNSKYQFDYMVNRGINAVLADYHETGISDFSADFVMFNQSFGYGDPLRLMAEAARILKDGGSLAIYDFAPNENISSPLNFDGWEYWVYPVSHVINSAEKNNLKVVLAFNSKQYGDAGLAFLESSKKMREWHKKIVFPANAICMKFVKIPQKKDGARQ